MARFPARPAPQLQSAGLSPVADIRAISSNQEVLLRISKPGPRKEERERVHLRILQAESSCRMLWGIISPRTFSRSPARGVCVLSQAGREQGGHSCGQGVQRLAYDGDVWPGKDGGLSR